MKPEPPKRRSPYDGQYNEWKNRQDGPPEQAPVVAKSVVEYKLDEPPSGPVVRKPVKAGVPLPYANPLEIQRRQKEMQQRKVEDERRDQEKENLERDRREQERMKRVQEEREEADRLERERIKREEQARREQERQEHERLDKEQQERQRIEREVQERQRIEREQQERLRVEREQQERQRIEREQQERLRIEREQQERLRIEREQQDRQRIEREQQERQRREREEMERKRKEEWEKKEREREEFERRRQEDWKKQEQERLDRQQREKEEHEKRRQHETAGLDEMTRRERELEMMLEQKRREKEKRLKELERQLQAEREEGERMEQEFMERLRREREERKEPQRVTRPTGGSTQVHYVNDQGKGNESEEHQRNEDMRSNRPADYGKRGPVPSEENRSNYPVPVDHARRPPNDDNRRNFGPGKRPSLQDSKDESFDMDPAEVERQFQQRLAQEAVGKSEVDGPKVIRVPVQQDNWEPRGNARDMEDRPRARVDYQREEEQRNRKEQQWRREQDEQLVRDFQQNESFRQPPPGTVAEPVHQHQGDWEKDEELRRQREEDDRLREARANQLRNRIIERPEDDEDVRSTGRTRRVKFASVRTEIIQPPPDAEVAKHDVKFVHDGKVMDSDDEEFPRPPPPLDEDEAPLPPPPPQDQVDYYQRPPPPPKPQNLISNGGAHPPEYHSGYRDNEHVARARARISDESGYATYPGRQQHVNNNHPTPKPRAPAREAEQFGKSPSPDQAKLPFKDKMKVFNDNTPPKRQTASKWEQRWVNGDSL